MLYLINNYWIEKKKFLKKLKIYGLNYRNNKKIYILFGLNIKFNLENIYVIKYLSYLDFIISQSKIQKIKYLEQLYKLFSNYKKISHYKGKRLISNLPLNGQRTHTNARNSKKLLQKWI